MKKLIFTCIYVFLFAVASGANCEETLSNFRLGDATWGGFNYDDKTKEYTTSLNSPIVSFSYKTTSNSATGIQWRVDEYIDNAWKTNLVSESKSGTSTIQLSKSARRIRFVYSGNFAGDFSNIKITQGSYLEIPTGDINFGVKEEGSSIPNKSITIEYSALNEDITASIGEGVFSIDKTDIASAGCTFGSTTLNVSFKPTQLGTFADEITFSNGTVVKVYGEYSRKINTTLKVVKESYTSVSLGWTKVDDATAYRVIENSTGTSYIVDGNLTSFNFRGLQTNTSYSFTLYALFDGVASLNSSNVVTAKTLQTDVPIQDCIVYENAAEKKFMASTEENITYDLKTGNSESLAYTKRVAFEARMQDATVLGVTYPATVSLGSDMKLFIKLEGESEFKESGWNAHDAGITENYKKFTVEIPYNTVAIRFYTGLANGGCWRLVKNLKVYKDRKLETKTVELNFGEVEPNVSISKTFDIDYIHAVLASDVTYDNGMRVVVEDGLGHYKVEYDQKNLCAEGSQAVKVTFTPTNCTTDYNATLTLLNGETVEVKLKGTLKRNSGTVSEITWTGAVDTNWDNRANWIKADGNVLSAADVLDEKLKVNIPASLTRYPIIPDVSTPKAFKEDRDKACDCAQVNAGDNTTATMIADKIYMESGAALVGVETLKTGDVSRYREVQMDFTPERYNSTTGFYEWSLVGPVVKPWDEGNLGNTRDVVSGDYYKNDLPHVYMHEAVMIKDGEDNVQTWDNSFASLTVKIPHDKAFAIRMPNQYGRNSSGNGIPAQVYNRRNDTKYDHTEDITFTFTGRFYNENALPKYTGLTPEQPVLLNNTYPANIDVDKLQSMCNGSIQIYEGHSFSYAGGRKDAVISSHYGFIFTPGLGVTELTIPQECFQTTAVDNNRSAEAEVQSFRLQLKNENVDGVYSAISISHDELKDDAADYAVDAPKLFNDMEENLADLYVMRYDSKWAGLTVPTVEESLPLGIKVRTANQKHKFNLLNSNLDCDIILEDRQEAKEYNLSAGEVCEVSDLVVGDCRGRFYLKTSESQEEDEDVTTDVFESEVSTSIDIYANGNSVTVSSNDNIRNIIVSDLSGRQMNYNVNGQYIVLDLPVASGIYTINVIGDNTSRIAKVKLN